MQELKILPLWINGMEGAPDRWKSCPQPYQDQTTLHVLPVTDHYLALKGARATGMGPTLSQQAVEYETQKHHTRVA
jgi:hypothetical protein